MQVKFVVFRYQPDLEMDKWVPLGVVAEYCYEEQVWLAVICLNTIAIDGVSDLASAMLQDVPTILRKEIDDSRARIRPGDDFLEVLRSRSPWNFHFSVPASATVQTDDIMQAAMELFNRHVWRSPSLALQQSRASNGTIHKPPMSIRPRSMEVYEVAV